MLPLLLLALAAAPSPGTGHWLLDQCDAVAQDRLEVCHAFLWGAHSGITFALEAEAAASKQPTLRLYCTPKGFTSEPLRAAVVKWLRANPQRAGLAAGGVVLLAAKDAFPCR
jgi:Ssp1 endopeptidase immunity protein Rap1a